MIQLSRVSTEGAIARACGAFVSRAATLLRGSPTMPVTDVAYACGFDSLATFYRDASRSNANWLLLNSARSSPIEIVVRK